MFSYALMLIRCLLGLVLIVAAIGKLWRRAELEEFSRTLRIGLRLPAARVAATLWAALEGLTAVLLALPLTVRLAAVLAAVEFGLLTAGAALLAAQRRDFTCNCFGTGHATITWRTVLRNAALTAAAVLLAAGLHWPAATTAPVVLAAVLTVLVGAVLAGQAGPLRALLRQSATRRPAAPGSALPLGGRR